MRKSGWLLLSVFCAPLVFLFIFVGTAQAYDFNKVQTTPPAYLFTQKYASEFTLCVLSKAGFSHSSHSAIPEIYIEALREHSFGGHKLKDLLDDHLGSLVSLHSSTSTAICIVVAKLHSESAFRLLAQALNTTQFSPENLQRAKVVVLTQMNETAKDLAAKVWFEQVAKAVARNHFASHPFSTEDVNPHLTTGITQFARAVNSTSTEFIGFGSLPINTFARYAKQHLRLHISPAPTTRSLSRIILPQERVSVHASEKDTDIMISILFAGESAAINPVEFEVLRRLLVGKSTSLLQQSLVHRGQLASGVWIDVAQDQNMQTLGSVTVRLNRPEVTGAVGELFSTLEKVKRGQVSEEQIQIAKQSLRIESNHLFAGIGSDRTGTRSITTLITRADFNAAVVGRFVEELERVSKKQLVQLAHRLFTNHHVVRVDLPGGQDKISPTQIAEVIGASGQTEVDDGKRSRQLKNGLITIAQKFDRTPLESIVVASRIGPIQDWIFAAYPEALVRYLQKRTKTRSPAEFERYLDEKGITIKKGSGGITTRLEFSFVPESFSVVIAIISEMLNDPAINDEDLALVKNEMKLSADWLQSSSEYAAFNALIAQQFRWRGFGYGTRRDVDHITSARLQRYFRRVYQPRNLVISYAGHRDHEEFSEQIASVTAGLKNDSQHFYNNNAKPRPTDGIVEAEMSTKGSHDFFGLGYKVAIAEEDVPAMEIASALYFEKIKALTLPGGEKVILADKSEFFWVGGTYIAFITGQCLSSECKNTITQVQNLLSEMGSQEPSAKDMARVRQQYQLRISEALSPLQASVENADDMIMLNDLRYRRTLAAKIKTLTGKEVSAAIRRRIRKEDFASLWIKAREEKENKEDPRPQKPQEP